ncbi:carboxypeptidase-like regulatory domain-containing protein, partial [Acinetobacter baumannii]
GKISDAKTGEPLPGATVHLQNTKYTTVALLDGSYVFKNIPEGNYKLEVVLVGYKHISDVSVSVSDKQQINIPEITLENESENLKSV